MIITSVTIQPGEDNNEQLHQFPTKTFKNYRLNHFFKQQQPKTHHLNDNDEINYYDYEIVLRVFNEWDSKENFQDLQQGFFKEPKTDQLVYKHAENFSARSQTMSC